MLLGDVSGRREKRRVGISADLSPSVRPSLPAVRILFSDVPGAFSLRTPVHSRPQVLVRTGQEGAIGLFFAGF